MMLVELPSNIAQHCDIVKHFMRESDLLRFTTVDQVCMLSYDVLTGALVQKFTNQIIRQDDEFTLLSGGFPVKNGAVRGYYMYGVQTSRGECGCPLIAYDKNFERKMMGIHCAGQNDVQYQGVGQPVTQEKLRRHLSLLHPVREDSLMAPDFERVAVKDVEVELVGDVIELVAPAGFEKFMCCGETQFVNYQPVKTNIKPSMLHGVLAEPETKPARLRPFESEGVRCDPMAMARAKAEGVSVTLDPDRLDACVFDYKQVVNARPKVTDQRVLTFDEAIKGVEGDPCIPPLNRRTSAGFGWPKKSKTEWLGRNEDYVVDHPEVLLKRQEIMEILETGNRPTTVWQDVLKDERRPIAKVDAGKTRMFSVGEMVFVIIFRQFFGGFIAHVMRNRIGNEICVGINPYAMDWTRLARRLSSFGNNVVAGDFTNYDGTLNATVLWRVLDLINEFYSGTKRERTIRACLWSEIVNSLHQCGSTLYLWTHSNPSGCPITTVLNSVYHSIVARYVFLTCAYGRPGCYDLGLYRTRVRHANYGDDDVWNIHEEILPWFNQQTMTEAFRTIGMVYTDETKSSEVVMSRKLQEVRFLKRAFRWDHVQNRFRAPISLSTIYEMAMWVRGNVDTDYITSETLQEAVHELAQYDEGVFNEHFPNFERARQIIDRRVPTVFSTYRHYQEIEVSRWCDGFEPDC